VFSRSDLGTAMNTVYSSSEKATRTHTGLSTNFRHSCGNRSSLPAVSCSGSGSPDFSSQTLGSPVGGDAVASLGTTYEISGQITPQSHAQPHSSTFETAKSRFALQNKSAAFLLKTVTPKGKRWRIHSCLKSVVSRASGVTVLQHTETKNTKFSNLQWCGSVWNCPCCSAKITEHRRKEIESALNVHSEAGGMTLMVTLTHSHSRADDLAQLLLGEREAHSKMTAHRSFKALMARIGRIGAIRAREMTYGDAHGWHPHTHDVWLIAKPIGLFALEALQREVFALWAKACARAGLPVPTAKYGVKIDVAYSPAEYLAKFGHDTKWGTGRELTKSQSKRGAEDRWTPFDLLRETSLSEAESKRLFRVYAKATHGARQITWSRGLKDLMRIEELSDEELMNTKESHEPVARIATKDWGLIIANEQRAATLFAAREGGQRAVDELVDSLRPVTPAPEPDATHSSGSRQCPAEGPPPVQGRAESGSRQCPAEGPPPVQGRAESGSRQWPPAGPTGIAKRYP
jgi:hypothetical protein